MAARAESPHASGSSKKNSANDPHTATITVSAVAAGKATLTAYADDTKTVKASFDITVP